MNVCMITCIYVFAMQMNKAVPFNNELFNLSYKFISVARMI